MKFNNITEAIDFVLIKCANMYIDAEVGVKDSEEDFLIIHLNSIVYIPKTDNINKLYITVHKNFELRYLIMLNTILKEQFNIHINNIFIPNTEDVNYEI